MSDKDALRVLRTADGSEALTMATVHVFTDARNAIPEGSVDLDVSTANLANLRAAIVNSIPCMPVVCVCVCVRVYAGSVFVRVCVFVCFRIPLHLLSNPSLQHSQPLPPLSPCLPLAGSPE